MKTSVALSLFGIIAVALSGCGGNQAAAESMMKEAAACQSELATVLPTVKDEGTAKAATPKLKAIGERIAKNSKQFDDLHLSEAQKIAIYEKSPPDLAEGVNVAKEMLRVVRLNITDKDFLDAFAACGASTVTQTSK